MIWPEQQVAIASRDSDSLHSRQWLLSPNLRRTFQAHHLQLASRVWKIKPSILPDGHSGFECVLESPHHLRFGIRPMPHQHRTRADTSHQHKSQHPKQPTRPFRLNRHFWKNPPLAWPTRCRRHAHTLSFAPTRRISVIPRMNSDRLFTNHGSVRCLCAALYLCGESSVEVLDKSLISA